MDGRGIQREHYQEPREPMEMQEPTMPDEIPRFQQAPPEGPDSGAQNVQLAAAVSGPEPVEEGNNSGENNSAAAPTADNGQDQEEIDFDELEIEMPEPEQIDIEDPAREPDTVLATVEGKEVTLQDLYDEFDRIPEPQQQRQQYQQHLLLEQMVQKELLLQKAEEMGEIEETESYKNTLEELKASPRAEDIDDEELKESARVEVLLKREVVEEAEVTEDQLREMFDEHKQIMPEDADFKQLKPQLEQIILHRYVEDYIQDLAEQAEVEWNQEWMDEKKQEAQEALPSL